MGVGRSSSLRTTAGRSPLHDVRQPAPRDRGSTRYKFDAWTSVEYALRAALFSERHRSLSVIARSTVTPLQILNLRLAWWSQTGSNRRPPACKAGALPTELWPRSKRKPLEVVGLGRLELPTSRLSSARSNQLSYKPDEASSSGLQPDGANHDGKRKGNEGGGTAPLSNVEVRGGS